MSGVLTAPPGYSLAERDRRWATLRALMAENDVDVLLVAGFQGRERLESYVADDFVEGVTIFPADGAPTQLTWTGSRLTRAEVAGERGEARWIEDLRVLSSGPDVARVVVEHGPVGRLGVIGLDWRGPGEQEGVIPARFWTAFLAAIGDVEIVELSEAFARLTLRKSDEEIAALEYAAAVCDLACRRMADAVEPGVSEAEIYAEVLHEIHRHACAAPYPTLNLHSGPANLAWGPPRWVTRNERPRVVARGDLVQAEIFPAFANQEVQAQLSVALDPVDAANRECERIAVESYRAGLAAVRPGASFADLVAAMDAPLAAAGAWAKTPLVHTLGPVHWIGFSLAPKPGAASAHRTPPSDWDLSIEAGMAFALEPNACIDGRRVNVGGTVLVTEDGGVELIEFATRVHHKG